MEGVFMAWIFWATVIGLLANRKNLNGWAWGMIGALVWPIGLIALAFQKFRCGACGEKLVKPGKDKLCEGCTVPVS